MFSASRLFGTACALLLWVGAAARADQVGWHFESSGTPIVHAGGAGLGGVVFAYDPPAPASGDSHVTLANLWTFSDAAPGTPDTLSGAPYTVSLTLTDDLSGKSGTIDFAGELHGLVTAKSALVLATPTSPIQQSLALGQNLYTVLLAGFSPPGPPESSNAGAISALVTVQPNHVPEPAALVLAGLGAAFLGVRGWRNRRALRCES